MRTLQLPGLSYGYARFGPEDEPSAPYRYELSRDLGHIGRRVLFIMLNPSTADAQQNDPTIRRCIGFAHAWGFGHLDVGNLFAFRSTDPSALLTATDPVGEANDAALIRMATQASRVVCAWGQHRAIGGRADHVLALLQKWSTAERVCLGRTLAGAPRHPLYVRADVAVEPI